MPINHRYPAWISCSEKKRRDRKVTMQIWPTHLTYQAQERTVLRPPLVCGRRLERTQRREKKRTGARKKGRARGTRVCALFSRAHAYYFIARELSCLLRLPHRLCQLEGRPVPIQYKKEKSVYHLVKIHTQKKH